jgi:hypothetical protein
MHRLALLAVGAAAALAVPTAQARQHPRTSLSVSTLRVVFGGDVTLSGRVSDHRAGTSVSVLARSFTGNGMVRIATVTAGAGGRWHYAARPSIATTYEATVAGAGSPTLLVGVRPALSMRLLGSGGVWAHAAAARSFKGRFVQLQRQVSPGRFSTIAKLPLGRGSTTTFPASALPRGTQHLRLAMSVNQAGSGYLGSFSRALVYPARWVSLSSPAPSVVYGNSVTLSGRVSAGKPGVSLRILARPFVQPEFQQVATVRTGSAGRWHYTVTPPFATSYQASYGNATSNGVTIGVRPAMTIRTISGDRIWAHVGLARSVAGKFVQIQRRTARGGWKTIAKLPLDRKAIAIFTPPMLPGGTSTLRTAISINQAGAGFLGGFSRPFVYHR